MDFAQSYSKTARTNSRTCSAGQRPVQYVFKDDPSKIQAPNQQPSLKGKGGKGKGKYKSSKGKGKGELVVTISLSLV